MAWNARRKVWFQSAAIWAASGILYGYTALHAPWMYAVRLGFAVAIAVYAARRAGAATAKRGLQDGLFTVLIGSGALILVSVVFPSPIGAPAIVYFAFMELLVLLAGIPCAMAGGAWRGRRARLQLLKAAAQPPPPPNYAALTELPRRPYGPT